MCEREKERKKSIEEKKVYIQQGKDTISKKQQKRSNIKVYMREVNVEERVCEREKKTTENKLYKAKCKTF